MNTKVIRKYCKRRINMENENVKINESLTSNVLDQNRQKKEINIDSSHLGIVRKIVFE